MLSSALLEGVMHLRINASSHRPGRNWTDPSSIRFNSKPFFSSCVASSCAAGLKRPEGRGDSYDCSSCRCPLPLSRQRPFSFSKCMALGAVGSFTWCMVGSFRSSGKKRDGNEPTMHHVKLPTAPSAIKRKAALASSLGCLNARVRESNGMRHLCMPSRTCSLDSWHAASLRDPVHCQTRLCTMRAFRINTDIKQLWRTRCLLASDHFAIAKSRSS